MSASHHHGKQPFRSTPGLAPIRRVAIVILGLVSAGPVLPGAGAAEQSDVLEQSKAAYAALQTYADTGVVIAEFGVSSREQHRFTTRLSRSPRGFLFDFEQAAGDRYVIWGDPQAFHTWWKATGQQSDHPNPNNSGAFLLADSPTLGAALKIPALLYAKASLPGTFLHFEPRGSPGEESFDGHRCYLVSGTSKDVYGATGREVNVRSVSIWVDAQTLLIRKVVEEWPPVGGQTNRRTTLIEPQANPALQASAMQFTAPAR
jgi:outer membrane lipoprotein-sorting protein